MRKHRESEKEGEEWGKMVSRLDESDLSSTNACASYPVSSKPLQHLETRSTLVTASSRTSLMSDGGNQGEDTFIPPLNSEFCVVDDDEISTTCHAEDNETPTQEGEGDDITISPTSLSKKSTRTSCSINSAPTILSTEIEQILESWAQKYQLFQDSPKKGLLKSSSYFTQPSLPRRSPSSEVESRLPKRNETTRRGALSFRGHVEVLSIDSLKELAEYPDGLWYRSDELDRIQQLNAVAASTIKMQRQDSASPSESSLRAESDGWRDGSLSLTERGLERFLYADQIAAKRKQAWNAVLNEQDIQRLEGVHHEEVIARAYAFSSFRSVQEAAKRAISDEREAKRYLQIEDEEVI